ncbi:MAG: N-acetyltransferase [Pseudomonadota bacterium]
MTDSAHCTIQPTRDDELDAIQAVHRAAFGAEEGPLIVELLQRIWADASARPWVSLAAKDDGQMLGHVLFTPVKIEGAAWPRSTYILSPLAVLPPHQRSGIGRALIESGLRQLHAAHGRVVLVYGDPAYYARSGFQPAQPLGLQPPHPIEYHDGWQIQTLQPDALVSGPGVVQCCESLNDSRHW